MSAPATIQATPADQALRLELTTLAQIHQIVVLAGVERHELLGGIDRRVVQGLRTQSSPSSQTLYDLHELNSMGALDDGSRPLETWLRNAWSLVPTRRDVIERALREIRCEPATLPDASEARTNGRARWVVAVTAGVLLAALIGWRVAQGRWFPDSAMAASATVVGATAASVVAPPAPATETSTTAAGAVEAPGPAGTSTASAASAAEGEVPPRKLATDADPEACRVKAVPSDGTWNLHCECGGKPKKSPALALTLSPEDAAEPARRERSLRQRAAERGWTCP